MYSYCVVDENRNVYGYTDESGNGDDIEMMEMENLFYETMCNGVPLSYAITMYRL